MSIGERARARAGREGHGTGAADLRSDAREAPGADAAQPRSRTLFGIRFVALPGAPENTVRVVERGPNGWVRFHDLVVKP